VWDVLDVGPVKPFYSLPEQRIFGKANTIELLNMIIVDHIFPEICVYRTEPMQKIFFKQFQASLVFVYLANILEYGDVAFLPQRYYRSVGVHPGLPSRVAAGAVDVLNNRDAYEGGLQYLALRCFQYLGYGSIPAEQLPVLRDMIRTFMDNRLIAASEMLVASNGWFRATTEFLIRRRAIGLLPDEVAAQLGHLPGQAALEAFLEVFVGMPALQSIGVAGFADGEAVRGRLLEMRPDAPVHLLAGPTAESLDPQWMLVLAGPGADRQALLDRGHLPGLVLNEAEIARQFRF
jgi:hypothetical protein